MHGVKMEYNDQIENHENLILSRLNPKMQYIKAETEKREKLNNL